MGRSVLPGDRSFLGEWEPDQQPQEREVVLAIADSIASSNSDCKRSGANSAAASWKLSASRNRVAGSTSRRTAFSRSAGEFVATTATSSPRVLAHWTALAPGGATMSKGNPKVAYSVSLDEN